MKHLRALSRAASVAAACATVVASLAATSGPATAEDDSPSVDYSCTFTVDLLGVPVSATLTVPVTASVPDVPMWDGTTVAAGAAPISATLDLDALTDLDGLAVSSALVQLIGFDGSLGGSLGLDAAHPVGVGSVPATASLAAAPLELDDVFTDGTLTGSGSLDPFVPHGTGLEDVTLPATFSLVPQGTSGPSVGALLPVTFAPVTCTSATGTPTVVGQVNVAAAGTTWRSAASVAATQLSIKGPRRARRGHAVVFRVALPGESGRVVARVGRRVVGQASLRGGAARVRVQGLRAGTNRIVFSAGTARGTATVRVR